ncbi:MAG: GTPase, partial [Anaerovoracaceae bacterium]
MSKAVLAIIGRPNVGKSTLFNAILKRRISIVEDTPGVTRDRIFGEAEWTGREFALIDTGGIEPATKELIPSKMREQAEVAIDMADSIIFLVDGKAGLQPED